MTGDIYMCEHVSKPTLGSCYKCASERKTSRKLAQSNSKSEDTLLSDKRIKKAMELSIQDQNEMTEKAQVTSLDDIKQLLIDYGCDEFECSCPFQEKLLQALNSWHKAEIAKLFEQIRVEVINKTQYIYLTTDQVAKGDYGDDVARHWDLLRAKQLEALNRLELKDE